MRPKLMVSFVVATLVASPPLARAQTTGTVAISVDATSAGSPIERVWAFHGYDEVNYTAIPSGQALLKTLGAIHTTPPHIRTHFLLNTGNGVPSFKWGSTNAYTTDISGNPIYDWTLMDGIMDTITGAGAFPLVEIAFMPHDLSIHPDPYQNSGIYTLDGGCFYPPKDYTRWGALIKEWATHTSMRYPGAGGTWQWELWNEPDIAYWKGTPAQYDMLFDYTETNLHQVLPVTSLGGPAVAVPGAFLTQFLQHCATGTNAVSGAVGTRLDMVSFHAKGGATIVGGNVQMNLGHQLALHQNGFNIVASFPQFKQTPIVVTEADPDGCAACPVTQNPADKYRNSPAYGAYEVAMMKKTLELEARLGVKLRGLLTWAFLFDKQPYFAGYRVLSSNDIHLPVLNAFKLLGSLAGDRLPVTSTGALTVDQILASSVRQQPDIDAMATLDAGRVQVIVWNYHDDLVAAAAAPVHLSVKVPPSFGPQVTVTHLRVDETHGDPYTVWLAQGSPAVPSAAQIAALQQAMQPAELQPAQAVAVVGNAVSVDFVLPRFGVSLITLAPVAPGGGPADASAGDSASTASGDGAPGAPPGGESGSGGASDDGATGAGGPATGSDGAAAALDGSVAPRGTSSSGSVQTAAGTPAQRTSSGCTCDLARSGGARTRAERGLLLLPLALGGAAARQRGGRKTPRPARAAGRRGDHDKAAENR